MDVIWTAEFANAGWLRPYEGELEQQVTENVFDSVIETASFEGKVYGAPFNSNTQVLWYRTDEARQAPATWDEMISEAERLDSTIQVQANRYEGFTVWVNYMIESAGGQILSGPEEVDLPQGPTEEALSVIGRFANSPAAPSDIDTSDRGHRKAQLRGRVVGFHAQLHVRTRERHRERARRGQEHGLREAPHGSRGKAEPPAARRLQPRASAPIPSTPSSRSRPPPASRTPRASSRRPSSTGCRRRVRTSTWRRSSRTRSRASPVTSGARSPTPGRARRRPRTRTSRWRSSERSTRPRRSIPTILARSMTISAARSRTR